MLWKKDVLFCEINPIFYSISEEKEIFKRNIKNLSSIKNFAKEKRIEKLPNLVYESDSNLIKTGKGIDKKLQENKVVNINIASNKITGIIIKPGEIFSFWYLVGKLSRKSGYRDGRVIFNNELRPGIGGGLCNLGNTIHNLILRSPLDVIEFHKHSDALAPDSKNRIPFSSGTSVSYNYLDYRFKNNTDQSFQIILKCENNMLHSELRSEKEIPFKYNIIEEDHYFKKEGEKYYRNSKIYREVISTKTGKKISKELILDNHSEVMYDYSLIPKELIKK